jgi:D-alanine--poly(phosphoribitol) ligase subunit 1
MIAKDALSHYVAWVMDAMAITPQDRWSQHPNIAFDLSVIDIYGTLCAGAALVPIVTPQDTLMPAKSIAAHQLTIWDSVPSVITSMVKMRQVNAANFASLRMLTFCGEPLQEMHLDAIFRARPDVIVHNTYGPTEATVSCTLVRLTVENYKDACRANVAIGDAIPGMELHLVGGPHANEGEIAITGPQLADGYWNAPDLTARQFRELDTPQGPCRAYFTGDWAARIGRHTFFAERMDTQVKIRGERVELGDISAALMKCELGFACAILVDDVLHAAFEHDGALPTVAELRETIGTYLPLHLIPTHFHALPEMPRNPNGKVDMKALKSVLAARPAASR